MWWRDAADGEGSPLLSDDRREGPRIKTQQQEQSQVSWRSRISERSAVRVFAALVLSIAVMAVFRSNKPLSAAAPPTSLLVTTATCANPDSPVLGGADVVAYFLGEVAFDSYIVGSPEHTAILNGFTFYFASDAHKAMFEGDPWRFAPQWGAFCSWGIARENWWDADDIGAPADPQKWLMLDGKLYFFRDDMPVTYFAGNGPGALGANLQEGNKHWSDWFGAIPSDASPFNTVCLCSPETCD
ncbi:unnamed protein product [Phaeothamnion confervicola]